MNEWPLFLDPHNADLPRLLDNLKDEDYQIMKAVLGGVRRPDVVLAPDGFPYLYRWHLIPTKTVGSEVFFHLQVTDDPERPLHDHPWDNTSVILSGGYIEFFAAIARAEGRRGPLKIRYFRPGDVITRSAWQAHRLILRDGVPYSMSLFMTGPKIREWGFWTPEGWVHNQKLIDDHPGISVWKGVSV